MAVACGSIETDATPEMKNIPPIKRTRGALLCLDIVGYTRKQEQQERRRIPLHTLGKCVIFEIARSDMRRGAWGVEKERRRETMMASTFEFKKY